MNKVEKVFAFREKCHPVKSLNPLFLMPIILWTLFANVGAVFELFMGGDNLDIAYSVQETNDGGYIVTGYTKSVGENSELLLSKFDVDGTHNWTTTLGGSGNDEGYSVQQTNDGGYIVAGYTSSFGAGGYDVLLSKFSFNGTHTWTRTLAGTDDDDRVYSVQVTTAGGYIVTGYVHASDGFESGNANVLLSKFNTNGSHNWTVIFGGDAYDRGYSVQETSDGGYVVTGCFNHAVTSSYVLLSKFSSNGTHTWTRALGRTGYISVGRSVQETSDGGYIIAGHTNGFGAGGADVLLSKFSSNGTHNWTKTLGGSGTDEGYSVQLTSDGGFIVGGRSTGFGSGGSGVLLSKFSSNGTHHWTTLAASGYEGRSVQETSDGGYIVTGFSGNSNVFLAKFVPTYCSSSPCPFSPASPIVKDVSADVIVIPEPGVVFRTPIVITKNWASPTIRYPSLPITYEWANCGGFTSQASDFTARGCYGHGYCIEPNRCSCSDDYYGEDCSVIVCDVFFSNQSHVCSDHGKCITKDNCDCDDGYDHETFCKEWSCYGFSNRDACRGHGKCVSPDHCVCDTGYEGSTVGDCQDWRCFDKKNTNKNVCNGHGVCFYPDKCFCDSGYSEEDCSYSVNLALGLGVGLPLTGILSLGILICCLFSLLLLLFCCCWFCCILCWGCVFISRQLRSQEKRISRFGQLRNFEMLLQEQEMEESGESANISINKKLFTVEMDEIRTIKTIGEGGSNSVVFLAEWSGKLVAYKVFRTRTLMNNQDKFDEFEREVDILSSVNHPCVIRFFGATLKPPRVGILMEYCPKGEILDYVLKFRKDYLEEYPIPEKLRLLIEVCSALEYLHSRNVIHRDLKSENVLISDANTSKLMDFGLSRVVDRMSVKKTRRIESDKPYGVVEEFQIELKVANDPKFRPNMELLQLPELFTWVKNVITRCWHHEPNERHSCNEIREILLERRSETSFPQDNEPGVTSSKKKFEEETKIAQLCREKEELEMIVDEQKREMEELRRKNEELLKEREI